MHFFLLFAIIGYPQYGLPVKSGQLLSIFVGSWLLKPSKYSKEKSFDWILFYNTAFQEFLVSASVRPQPQVIVTVYSFVRSTLLFRNITQSPCVLCYWVEDCNLRDLTRRRVGYHNYLSQISATEIQNSVVRTYGDLKSGKRPAFDWHIVLLENWKCLHAGPECRFCQGNFTWWKISARSARIRHGLHSVSWPLLR